MGLGKSVGRGAVCDASTLYRLLCTGCYRALRARRHVPGLCSRLTRDL